MLLQHPSISLDSLPDQFVSSTYTFQWNIILQLSYCSFSYELTKGFLREDILIWPFPND